MIQPRLRHAKHTAPSSLFSVQQDLEQIQLYLEQVQLDLEQVQLDLDQVQLYLALLASYLGGGEKAPSKLVLARGEVLEGGRSERPCRITACLFFRLCSLIRLVIGLR